MTNTEAFAKWLQTTELGPGSQRIYARTAKRWGEGGPIPWLKQQITNNTPMGTIGPIWAAIIQWTRWDGMRLGRTEAETEKLLVGARAELGLNVRRKGRRRRERDALGAGVFQLYLRVVSRDPALSEDVRDLLLLLPATGLRISEACALARTSIETRPPQLRVIGKGDKERLVPLNKDAIIILRRALRRSRGRSSLFDTTPALVREHVRRLREAHPGLPKDLCPHVLRHTSLTRLLRAGVDLRQIQAIAGHAQMSTTARYLHPDQEDLAASMKKIELGAKP